MSNTTIPDFSAAGTPVSSVLVDAQWLEEHLDDPTVRVVEVDVSAVAHGEGHIPGAVLWNVYQDLKDPEYHLVSDAALQAMIERSGIAPDSTVVFYRYAPAMGFWLMKRFRHADARILNTSCSTWIDEERPWTQEVVVPAPAQYPLPVVDDTIRATRAMTEQAIDDPALVVLDVRSDAEYRGERFWPSGGFEEGGRAGHVPSAVLIPAENFYDPTGAFKPATDLAAQYSAIETDANREVITYCTIGGRACTTWFVLTQLLGHDQVRVYDGSWAEWGRTPDAPVE